MNKRTAHNRHSQSGNIFFMLFASVALVGAFGVGASNTMKGLVSSMSDVTRKSIAEEKMMGGARLAVQSATALQANSGDCDSDDMVEPLPFRSAGTGPRPVGGGYLPLEIGATPTDPWGTAYGYCVWDPGTVRADAGCGGAGANRLAGYGTTADDYTVVAVISAGKDRQFSTTCNAFVDTTPADGAPDTPLIVRGNGGDDIVLEYTYADANGLSGDDLWRVKDTSPDVAAIDKNIEVTGGAEMSGALALMDKGLVLPADPGDDSITGACTALNDQELRINAGMSPPVLEICYDNDWVAISMGDNGGGGSCGTNWTAQAATLYYGGQVYAGGMFVAAGFDLFTSTDGITWTTRTSPAGFGDAIDIAYGNGTFVAISSNGANRVATSTDGINWTSRTAAENNTWNNIAYGNGLFVAVSYDGTNRIMTSPNGVTWTARNVPAQAWEDVAYGNGRFVVNAFGGQTLTSFDGISWTHNTGNLVGWAKLLFADGLFISSSDSNISTSTDGVNWTSNAVPDGNWHGMTYVPGLGLYVAVAYIGDERVMTSTDAVTWTAQTPANTANYNNVIYGNNILVAIAGDGSVMTSTCAGGDAEEEEEDEITAFLPDPIAQYHLDETSGTTITDSKGGASGTLSGTTLPSSLVGRSGRAIDFDGTDDRILVGTNASVNGLTTMTISGWLRRDAGSGTEIIYTNRNTGSTGIVLQVNATLGRLNFLAGSGGSWTADIGYTMGSWTHFAVTYDASNLTGLPTFYANGEQVPVISGSQPASFTAGAAGASIGSNYGGSASFFNGALDDLRIYGIALPAQHISLLYNDRPVTTSIAPNPSVILAANKYRGRITGGLAQNGCMIKEDNSAWCWGDDSEGQLGNGAPLTQQDLPQRVDTLTTINNFTQITAGSEFACGIKADGSAWCWGSDNSGQLGNGAAITANQPNPVLVDGNGVWTQLSAGNEHICGIQRNGTLWCWGWNAYGQISTGGVYDAPFQVVETGPWVYVAAGDRSTCAIKTNGTLWCWGSHEFGVLGRGGPVVSGFSSEPPEMVAEPGPWVHVSRQEESTCAVKLDGSGWCWGQNTDGELGIGTTGPSSTVPKRIADPGPWLEINGNPDWQSHCGIKLDGTGWCWGRNYQGNLGIGSEVEANHPTPTQVADPGPWATIELSRFGGHGIKTDGSGWSWGFNYEGGLGINQTFTGSTSFPRPIDASMDVAPFAFNAAQTVLTKNAAGTTISIGTNGKIAYDGSSGGFGHVGSGRSVLVNPNGNSILNITAAGAYDSQLTFNGTTGNNDPSMGVDNVTGNFEIVSKAGITQWMSALTPQIEITSTGMVGVGTSGTPAAKLDIVGGGLKVGDDTRTCTLSRKGVLRYNGTALQYCNGSLWTGF